MGPFVKQNTKRCPGSSDQSRMSVMSFKGETEYFLQVCLEIVACVLCIAEVFKPIYTKVVVDVKHSWIRSPHILAKKRHTSGEEIKCEKSCCNTTRMSRHLSSSVTRSLAQQCPHVESFLYNLRLMGSSHHKKNRQSSKIEYQVF